MGRGEIMDKLFWDRDIFKGISQKSIDAINKMKKREQSYDANEFMIMENEDIDEFCIILDGVVKSTEYTAIGKELNSSYFFGGDSFPFYLVYGGKKKYFFNTLAVKKTKVVWLDVEELIEIINNDKVFLINILEFVARYTISSKLLLRCVQYRKVIERLSYWIIHINDPQKPIPIPSSQEVLSDMLHVNRSSLNLEIHRLCEIGVIELRKKNIIVKDIEYLESMI